MITYLVRYRRLLGVLLFLAIAVAAFQWSGLRGHFDLAFIRQLIARHPLGGLVLFVLLFALGNLIQIPGWLFLAAAVLALGRVGGGLVTYIAAVLSCAATFVTIRAIGGDALRLITNRLAVRLLRELDTRPVRSVALLRVVFQTAPPVNYALAMSGIRFRAYMIGTMLGLPLPIALYCLFFDLLAAGLHIT